jgi:hypothetical protein
MRLVKFPSISQFRDVVKNVKHRASYIGSDADGNPMYNNLRTAPTLKFEGTVKIHGTNFGCISAADGEMWFQSREHIITPEKDNAGSAMFGFANNTTIVNIVSRVRRMFDITTHDVAIFFEWSGGNIQKGVAISQLPKMAIIIGIALVDGEGQKNYLTRNQVEEVVRGLVERPNGEVPLTSCIYSIYDFPTYQFTIDFEQPHLSQNELNAVMLAVEGECPVGKAFGVSGIGEGIVVRCIEPDYTDSGYWMKCKGSEHSKSKVKTLARVDVEKIDNINQLAETLANNGRLDQMCQQTFDLLNGGEIDINSMGDFIRAVFADIIKEDLAIIAASGFNMKELNGSISKIARNYITNQLQ